MGSRILTFVLLAGLVLSLLALVPQISALRLPGNQQGYEPVQPFNFTPLPAWTRCRGRFGRAEGRERPLGGCGDRLPHPAGYPLGEAGYGQKHQWLQWITG